MASSAGEPIIGKTQTAPHGHKVLSIMEETKSAEEKHLPPVSSADNNNDNNLVYDEPDEEPELHARTYIALLSMFLLNMVQVVALQGPPAVLSYIGKSLNNPPAETWVTNSLSLVQAVLGPVISAASDTFQARKTILVGTSLISLVGSAIAPGSGTIYRLIAAQTLIGVGFASVPLAYAVPSEILPRKWRPMAQACMNIAAAIGAIIGPLIIGALTRNDQENGWRKFYWIQLGLWAATALGILIGYRPPKRHTRLDHLSFLRKLGHLDLPGCFLLTARLSLFLTGLNLGGGLYSWTNVRSLTTLVLGIAILIGFGVYEWKGTRSGILHHDLFKGGRSRGQTFAICVLLILIEGILFFSFIIFYPIMSTNLFPSDPFHIVSRSMPFWSCTCLSTVLWGMASTKFRTIREPLFLGYVLFTAGIIGWATVEPSHSGGITQLCMAGLAGFGFGAPLILIIAGVQLSTPHRLIATATAVTTSSRAVGATVFTAIFSAALNARLDKNIPGQVSRAVLNAGLPAGSVGMFIKAVTGNGITTTVAAATESTRNVPGVSPAVVEAGVRALKQAFAASLRVVYEIAAPFGAVACIACWALGDLSTTMDYRVDAPVEDLHAKQEHHLYTQGQPGQGRDVQELKTG
ncbi:hypothetical protein ABEF93_001442 [Exophiala dermatitidis]